MKNSKERRRLLAFALSLLMLPVATTHTFAWTREVEKGGEGRTVVDANGVVVGALLNDTMLVRKMNSGYVKLIFDEYGFVASTRLLIFEYETTDCSGTPYLQHFGVPPIGVAAPEGWQTPPYRGAAEIYFPGPPTLRMIGSYSYPMEFPPAGCVKLHKPSKVLAGTVEKQDLHFTPPFTLK